MENYLEQQVAQFPGKLARVGRLHRVENLVRFLNQKLSKRLVGLLAVPGASAGPIQPSLQGHQLLKPSAGKFVARGDRNPRFGWISPRPPQCRRCFSPCLSAWFWLTSAFGHDSPRLPFCSQERNNNLRQALKNHK